MRKITFFTSTRADYGLLKPIMSQAILNSNIELSLIVTGTHLINEHGYTYNEIKRDQFKNIHLIDYCYINDEPVNLAKSCAILLEESAKLLSIIKPHILVLLGDRYELLAIANASILNKIPIAHIHGGEITEGAIDDSIRHAITKLSTFHFPATEEYKNRILQLGESKNHVWNVGAPGLDNILKFKSIKKNEIENYLDIKLIYPSFIVTYHPETNRIDNGLKGIIELVKALKNYDGSIIITGVNADPGRNKIAELFHEFTSIDNSRIVMVDSLGSDRYFSLMNYIDIVIGNSSSGIIEAPSLGVPTVNIGNRQKGRIHAKSIINCKPISENIISAIDKALTDKFKDISSMKLNPYGKSGASKKIVNILSKVNLEAKSKIFQDIK